MQVALLLVALTSSILLALPASAGAPSPASQLRSDCRAYVAAPDSPDGRRCIAYIQGLLDGVVAASRPIAQAAAAPAPKTETFSERAMRTRLRERDRNLPQPDPGICVADEIATVEVVKQVISHVDANPPAAGDTAAAVVLAALRARFPCGPVAN
ncbi:MAG: Rap1a/Tai family immunity protein [Steroidobacteraceae bacterium]